MNPHLPPAHAPAELSDLANHTLSSPSQSPSQSPKSHLESFSDVADFVARHAPEHFAFLYRPHLLKRQSELFLKHFPGKTLYAVKCNPHPVILHDLMQAGILHFDVASSHEINLVQSIRPDAHCFFMHPVKSPGAIDQAWSQGICDYVIDHQDELAKLYRIIPARAHRDLRIFVRMALPDLGALVDLSCKFGAHPEQAESLLQAVEQGGSEPGLAFHVGTQIPSAKAYRKAIQLAARTLHKARISCHHFDIGGGFPVGYANINVESPAQMLRDVRTALEAYGLERDMQLYCEPGRAMVGESMSLLVQIHARRNQQLYINCGRYHGMLEMSLMELRHPVRLVRRSGLVEAEHHAMEDFVIQGATCDSLDRLAMTIALPGDVREGDWIEFGRCGSYSTSLITDFNGIEGGTVVTVGDRQPPC